jgi:Zn-finger nucleic acid-binding protein
LLNAHINEADNVLKENKESYQIVGDQDTLSNQQDEIESLTEEEKKLLVVEKQERIDAEKPQIRVVDNMDNNPLNVQVSQQHYTEQPPRVEQQMPREQSNQVFQSRQQPLITNAQHQQQQYQQPQYQQPYVEPTPPPVDEKIHIPFEDIQDPDVWLEKFLQTQASIKPKFITFQKQRVAFTQRLPEPMDLEADIKDMDSGVKNAKEAYYIKLFYEDALKKYIHKLKVDRDYGRRLMQHANMPPTDSDYGMGRGIPINRQPDYRYDPYEDAQRYLPPNRGQPNYYESELRAELMRLREQQAKRDEEERQRRDRENFELRQQNLQLQQKIAEGASSPKIDERIEKWEQERRQLERENAQLRDIKLQEDLKRIESTAFSVSRNIPSAEDINHLLNDKIEGYRTKLMVEKNIEDLVAQNVEKRLQTFGKSGPTLTDVELEKARNEFALGTKKLEMEEKKAEQWGETIKSVAGVFGEGVGKGMSSLGRPQPREEAPPQTFCPHCNVPLALPQNVRFGLCPSCNGKIEVDANGMPQPFMEPQQAPQPRYEQEQIMEDEQPPVEEPEKQQKVKKKKKEE